MSFSTTEPPFEASGPSAIVSAVDWLEATLLGTVATTLAIIAVAAIGWMMLNGRVDWRRGATTIFGCFVIFGASSIAAGIISMTATAIDNVPVPTYVAPVPPKIATPAPQRGNYDPYAGASVPER